MAGSAAEYRFILRPDAKWSDGTPLTPADFLFAYRMAVHPIYEKQHRSWTSSIARYQLTGQQEIRLMVYRSPLQDVLDVYPLPRHLLEKSGFSDPQHFSELPWHEAPIGDGPYRLTGSLKMERNPNYVVHPATLPNLELRPYLHVDDAVEDLAKGELDVLADVPPHALDKAPAGITVQQAAAPSLTMLVFNTRDLALRNDDLRRALAHALNRGVLAAGVGGCMAARSWLQPSRAGQVPAFDTYEGKLPLARAALQRSPWKADKQGRLVRRMPGGAAKDDTLHREIVLLYEAAQPQQEAAASAMQAAWEKLGLHAVLEARPPTEYRDRLQRRGFTVALQEVAVYPWTQPAALFSKESIPTARNYFRGDNASGWSTSGGQELLKKIAAAPEPAAAADALREQQLTLAREVPVLPLFFGVHTVAYRSGMSGVQSRGWGEITWNVEEWRKSK
jgi:ABC-type transport system substrate-binding protein